MPGNKYIAITGTRQGEVAATQVSAGAANANQIVALGPQGVLDQTVMPPGIGPDVQVLPATEALAAGAYINIWSNAGVFSMRNADGSTQGKQADGFVLSNVASGASGTAYLSGINNAVSGQVPGLVFLGSTAGQGSPTPPSSAASTFQQIGLALSATSVQFDPQEPINRA